MIRLLTRIPRTRPQRIPCLTRGVKTSIVDWEPIKAKKAGREGRAGRTIFMGLLVLIPVVSFGLGTWQVKRLKWKTNLIAQSEYRLSLPPLPLPPKLSPDVVNAGEFDYRRVTAEGVYRHDQEMLVGPRMHDGQEGFYVVTPLERKDGSKLLISRGWISKAHKLHSDRTPEALPQGPVQVECLLQRKPDKNMFTPKDDPENSMYHFMSIGDMAQQTGAQPIYIQALYDNVIDGYELLPEQMAKRGVPLGSSGKVNIRNTHFQYILTWYGLSLLTVVMLFRLVRQGRSSSTNSALSRKLQHARKNE